MKQVDSDRRGVVIQRRPCLDGSRLNIVRLSEGPDGDSMLDGWVYPPGPTPELRRRFYPRTVGWRIIWNGLYVSARFR